MSKHTKTVGLSAASIMVGLIAAAAAHAAAWQPTILLGDSTGDAAGVASDPAGTVTTVWSQPGACGTAACANLVARSRPALGAWGSIQSVKVGAGSGPTDVQALPGGNVVAAWTGPTGALNISERIAGVWQAPQTVGSSPSANFRLAGNGKGDLTLTWSTSTDLKAGGSVLAVTRHLGGTWSAASTITTTKMNGLRVYNAVLGRNGDTIVSWESITNPAAPTPSTAYEVHASRLVAGQNIWLNSPALYNGYEDNALVTIDDKGEAAILGYNPKYTQKNGASAWVPVSTPGYPVALGTNSAGQGTVVTANHLLVAHTAYVGSIAAAPITWKLPQSVATGGRFTYDYSFAEAADGHAVISMFYPSPRVYTVSARSTASGTWDQTYFEAAGYGGIGGYSNAIFARNATATLPTGGSVVVRADSEVANPAHLVLFAKVYE